MRGLPASFPGVALAALMTTTGCNGSATHDPSGVDEGRRIAMEVAAGEAFTLKPGTSARIPAAGLTVRFVEVESDSRCPTDAACVWAGDAVVVVEAVTEDVERVWRLHTPTEMVGPGSRELNGHVVKLVGLEPGHLAGEVTPQEDYRATFTVSEAEPRG